MPDATPASLFSSPLAPRVEGRSGPPADLRRVGTCAAVRGQRHRPSPHARLRPLARGIALDSPGSLGRGRGAAGGGHGQLRGRPPDPGRGADDPAGSSPHRPLPARRVVLLQPGASRRDAAREAQGRDAAPDGPVLGRRRALSSAPPRRPARDGGAAAGAARAPAPVHRRPRHVAEVGSALPGRARGAPVSRRRPGRDGVGPLLRHGPRQAVGPRGAGLPGAGVLPRPERGDRRGSRRGRLRARGDRRVHPTHGHHRERRAGWPDARRRRDRLLQLPSRPREAADAGVHRSGIHRVSASQTAQAPLHDVHGVQARVRPAGRLRAPSR